MKAGLGGGPAAGKDRMLGSRPMTLTRRWTASIAAAAAIVACAGADVQACSVPVFRYALERWAPDPYLVVVFHRGPLGQQDRAAAGALTEAASDANLPANIEVQTVDLAERPDQRLVELHKGLKASSLPRVAVVYPQREDDPDKQELRAAWSGPLDKTLARRLTDSPKRREIARRLLQGESAVWVLLECGDSAKDDAAAQTLSVELKKLQSSLQLSATQPADAGDGEANVDPRDYVSPAVPLRVAFSVVRVSRDDAAEQPFVSMLVGIDPKLKDQAADPIAFPIFGRGRALTALVGKEIAPAAIEEICEFLIDDCSCRVKELNPGFDLLMTADWEGLLGGQVVVDKALPPLTGVMPTMPASLPAATAPGTQAATRSTTRTATQPAPWRAPEPSGGGLVRNVLIALGAVIVLAGVGTILVRRRAAGR